MNFKQITNEISELTILDGEEHAEVYLLQLFPGVILGINYVNIHRITGNVKDAAAMEALRINYCFEGRCEVKLVDGRYVYVHNNALCIEDHEPQYNFHYPLGFYKGLQIFIDKSLRFKQQPEPLALFGVNLKTLLDTYCNTNQTFIQIASEQFDEKALELMAVWENESLTYEQKVQKIRFLLCYLFYYLIYQEAVNPEKSYNACTLSHSQYMIALDCEHKIMQDLSRKITVEALAAHYKVSPSSLKNYFSGVYGCSISEYTQSMRMKQAKQLLETTDLSVMHIAASVGYENQSKFSAVFKKHIGYAPLEYKRIYHLKRNEEPT